MDFIKRNKFTIVFFVLVLIASGCLLYLLMQSRKRADKGRASVDEVLENFKKFHITAYKLSQDNVTIATDNHVVAHEAFDQLVKKLQQANVSVDKAQVSRFTQEPSIIIDFLASTRNRFRQLLTNGHIGFPEQLAKGFTFEKWNEGFPKVDEVPLLVKQIQVVDALMDVLLDSEITELTKLQRGLDNELVPNKPDLYHYSRYTLGVKGTLPQIQALFEKLQRSEYFFVVHNISQFTTDFRVTGPTLDIAPVGGADGAEGRAPIAPERGRGRLMEELDGPTTQPVRPEKQNTLAEEWCDPSKRLILAQPVMVSVELTVDYVEFVLKTDAK